jgi:hypothetical protein
VLADARLLGHARVAQRGEGLVAGLVFCELVGRRERVERRVYDPAAPAGAYAYDRAAATRNWHLLLNRSTFLDPAAHAAFMCPDRENEAPIAGGAKLPAVHARHILTHDGDAVEKVRAARQRLAEKARTRLRGEL